jgi:hypothetical protein
MEKERRAPTRFTHWFHECNQVRKKMETGGSRELLEKIKSGMIKKRPGGPGRFCGH